MKRFVMVSILILLAVALYPRTALSQNCSKTNFGFNDGLDPNDLAGSLPMFEQDVDRMVANRQRWVKIGIASWEVTDGGDVNTIEWDQQNLAYYGQAISYAYRKGLNLVILTSGAPDYAQNYSFQDYETVSVKYWSYLAHLWAKEASVWQLFNEADADGSNYRTFAPNNGHVSAQYYDQMNALLGAGRKVIKQVNPNIMMTTNTTGYPMNDAIQENWMDFFAHLQGNLDIIMLDLYPVTDVTQISKLGERVMDTRQRFHKPVAVGEIGVQTCTTCYTEQQQEDALVASVKSLKRGGAALVLVYEFRDSGPDETSGDETFGIEHYDGSPKLGYDAILDAMQQ